MDDARDVLGEFLREEAPLFIPCDRRALDSTDIHFPRKIATLDEGIAHPVTDLIPELLVEP